MLSGMGGCGLGTSSRKSSTSTSTTMTKAAAAKEPPVSTSCSHRMLGLELTFVTSNPFVQLKKVLFDFSQREFSTLQTFQAV